MFSVIRKIGILFFNKNRRVRASETIDTLFKVTDIKQVFTIFADAPKNHILQPVGILILIQHDFLKLSGKFLSKFSRRPVRIGNQPQRKCRKVIKIRNPCRFLCSGHPMGELPYQREKAPEHRILCPQILFKLFAGADQHSGNLSAHLLNGVTPSLYSRFYRFRRRFQESEPVTGKNPTSQFRYPVPASVGICRFQHLCKLPYTAKLLL